MNGDKERRLKEIEREIARLRGDLGLAREIEARELREAKARQEAQRARRAYQESFLIDREERERARQLGELVSGPPSWAYRLPRQG